MQTPCLYTDYSDVMVPDQQDSTFNVVNSGHQGNSKNFEFMVEEAVRANDLLFPTQFYDLETLKSL